MMSMYVCEPCVVASKIRENTGNSGTGVMDGCEPPYGCSIPNLGPLEEQQVLITSGPTL